jgi:hypothetical protein
MKLRTFLIYIAAFSIAACSKATDAGNAPSAKKPSPEVVKKIDSAIASYAKIINSIEVSGLSTSDVQSQLNDADFNLGDATFDLKAQTETSRFAELDFDEEKKKLTLLFRWWLRFAAASQNKDWGETVTFAHIRYCPKYANEQDGEGGIPAVNFFKGGRWAKEEWSIAESIQLSNLVPEIQILGSQGDNKFLILNKDTSNGENLIKALKQYSSDGGNPASFYKTFAPITTKMDFESNFSADHWEKSNLTKNVNDKYYGVEFYDLTLYMGSEDSRNRVFVFLKDYITSIRLKVKSAITKS